MGITVTRVPVNPQGCVDPADIRRSLTPRTTLVAITHASNVTGAIQPIDAVIELARRHGALCLIDAAQTAGHVPINVSNSEIDLLACSGHKGLLGPLGTGLLFVRAEVMGRVWSFRQGGTGSRSESDAQPDSGPDKYESGNHNAPGLVGLEAGLSWIEGQGGVPALRRHEQELVQLLLNGLAQWPSVTLYGPAEPVARTGVVSLNVAGLDPQDAAAILDESFGIETRAGLHCAPGAHAALGTLSSGGTLRLSPGPFTTREQIAAAVAAIGEVAGY
ncbi:MAG: aminotransferase class V-fold PLP-dependent enzyme [Planctomycetaceae bacterium]